MDEIVIRNLNQAEMFIPVEFALRANRNPGVNDADFLFKADANGFFAAIINTSQVLGTISSVKYENGTAFIGFHYIVDHYRNSGLMEKMLEAILSLAGEVSFGINCSEKDVQLYEKFGFESSFKIISYRGVIKDKYEMAPNVISPFTVSFDELYAYYLSNYPYENKIFFYQWINQPKSLLLGKYEDGKYKGLGLFKPCCKGFRISPFVADEEQSAKDILISLISLYEEGTQYYLDIPETNIAGIKLLNEFGLEKIDETVRMYKGKEHDISLNKIYGLTSLEVG